MNQLIPRLITWNVLQDTRNEAAVAVLTSGLAVCDAHVRHLSLELLLARPESSAKKAILMHWENLSEEDLGLVQAHSQQFQTVAKDTLANGSLAEKRAVLPAIANLNLTESLAEIVKIVTDSRHALQVQANECLQELCRIWGERARTGRDVMSIRHPMLETLYGYLQDIPSHGCRQVVDAWLALVHWDDSLQRGLIADPGNTAFRVVLERLDESNERSVLQLLAGYALRPTTPRSVLKSLIQKAVPELALELTLIVDDDHFPGLLRRLRELEPLECLQDIELIKPKSFEEEKRLWMLVSASSQDFGQVLRGALRLAKSSGAEGRQIAADIVSQCRRPELEAVVAELQVTLAGIPKPDSFGPALMEIALWTTMPSVILQKAARTCLQDFTIQRLIEHIRIWPTTMCQAMAQIVGLMDANIADFLVKELESPSPKRRMAALQATQLLDLSEAVGKHLAPMLIDPRLEVRVRVIDVLSALGNEVIDELLPKLLSDASTDIQDAANRALRRRQRVHDSHSVATQELI